MDHIWPLLICIFPESFTKFLDLFVLFFSINHLSFNKTYLFFCFWEDVYIFYIFMLKYEMTFEGLIFQWVVRFDCFLSLVFKQQTVFQIENKHLEAVRDVL
jgi:hypothetical protein